MNCRSANALLSAFADGELSASQMQALRQHLAHCEACDAELKSIRAMKSMFANMASPALPEDFAERLHAAVFVESKVQRNSQLSWAGFFAIAAATCVAVFVALQSTNGSKLPSNPVAYDVSYDQGYLAGADPGLGQTPIITVQNAR